MLPEKQVLAIFNQCKDTWTKIPRNERAEIIQKINNLSFQGRDGGMIASLSGMCIMLMDEELSPILKQTLLQETNPCVN